MIFAEISPKQAARYAYMCNRLKQTVNTMHTARKTLEGIANTSFDKAFAKSVQLLTSESLQCENEILSRIDSLNCSNYNESMREEKKLPSSNTLTGLDAICNYLEEAYLKSYNKLLKDKYVETSIKHLIKNHLQMFSSSLTQLRLFNDVKSVAN